jgi:hypothetical protein
MKRAGGLCGAVRRGEVQPMAMPEAEIVGFQPKPAEPATSSS